jgi:hypothetical protein
MTMRSNRGVAFGVLAVIAVVGFITWAIVAQANWNKACHNAGGRIEQRYEYTQTNTHYTYDAKGNVTGFYITSDPVYSYHCWVGGQEVDPK